MVQKVHVIGLQHILEHSIVFIERSMASIVAMLTPTVKGPLVHGKTISLFKVFSTLQL